MKRRTFLLHSGAGLAAVALPALSQTDSASAAEGTHQEKLNLAADARSAHRPIVHPGILQTRADLDFMKAKIKAGEEPWKSAWDIWLTSPNASLDFEPKPFVHVIRGAYAAGERGGRELSDSASAANNHVMQWCVTGDAAH